MPAKREAASLGTYRQKRQFAATPEPKGKKGRGKGWSYVIQKHDATRLHYDFRLELDGVLKSWAVTRGPSMDPKQKRLAIRTEDHPLDYGGFEGIIPAGNYGAGTVMLWDRGTWEPIGDPHDGLERGKLAFTLRGERLRGRWALIHMRGKGERQQPWLLIKEVDDLADPRRDVLAEFQTSVATDRDLDAIAANRRSRAHGRTKPTARHSGAEDTRHARAPDFAAPQLATLVDAVPHGRDWLFEVKFDGYRVLTAASGDTVTCYTRGGLDWTGRFGALPDAIAALDLDGALLDGEVVSIDAKGRSDFSALQRALTEGGGGLAYFVFDLLAEGGRDLRRQPLLERKARLKAILGKAGDKGPVFFADHIIGDGATMLRGLCRRGLEGVIAKRADRPYRSGRGHDWLKIKCDLAQEFVVVGFTPSDKARPFASLLLGAHDKRALRYVGRVGTGFGQREMERLARLFKSLTRATPAVAGDIPAAIARHATWLKPELVAQIGYAGFTGDGMVRHARYRGLREDKPARAIGIERAEPLRATPR